MQVSAKVKLFSGCKPGGTEHPEQERKEKATIFQLKHSASTAHSHLQPVIRGHNWALSHSEGCKPKKLGTTALKHSDY